MWVRENGVEVRGEGFDRDVLLRTAWGVWEARVVGTFKGRSSLVDGVLGFFELWGGEGVHTEEYGEKPDLLFVGRWDCFCEHLMVSVVDPFFYSTPSLSSQAVDMKCRCHVDLSRHILSKPAWCCSHSNHGYLSQHFHLIAKHVCQRERKELQFT